LIKKKFYTITKRGRYSYDEVVHRCTDLDSAMDLFKYLVGSNTAEIADRAVPDNTREPDEDGYVPSVYLKYEKGESEYHIGTEIIDLYTEEEVEIIEKERNEWLAPFKEAAAKAKEAKKVAKKKK
jgi:hypothetical protein